MKNLFLFFILFASFYKYSLANDRGSTVYAYVNGLVCDFCARALEKTIGKNLGLKKKIVCDFHQSFVHLDSNGPHHQLPHQISL